MKPFIYLLEICFLSIIFGSRPSAADSMQTWLTSSQTRDRLLARGPDLSPNPGSQGGFRVEVNTADKDQEVKGYGAAISNSAAYLIRNSPQREEILQKLFDRNAGIGISYIRLTMGGSDFNAVPPYTYNDIPRGQKDFNLDRFSIDKDKEFVIPALRDMLRYNPNLKILASPWTAPGWMKYNDNLNGGTFIGEDAYYMSYAEYFIRFLRAYRDEGISIDALTLQNEPEHEVWNYPTMKLSSSQQAELIKKLGPRIQQEGFNTAIIAFDHNWDLNWYPMQVLQDAEARRYTAGTAWHCYGGSKWDPLGIRNAFPDKDIYFTECSGGEWDPSFDSGFGWNMENLFIAQSRVGARTVLLWNMALDENHGPRNVAGGCRNCRGVLTIPSSGSYTMNQEYYSIGHFSKFILPGARRVFITDHTRDWLETVAFENPDRSVVMVMWNRSWDEEKRVDITVNGRWYNYSIPTRTCVTLVTNN